MAVELEIPFLFGVKWENGEKEREGEERRNAGRSSLAGKSLPRETNGGGREMSTLL